MKILHYNLGIPPYSTGGLSIYSYDLAKIESNDNEVIIIYPGYKNKKLKLKKIKTKNNFKLYRLDGALPVSLTYGVKEPHKFIGHKNISEIEKVFKIFSNIDILHIHTLQGLYPEILKYFKNKNTKIIFTTHDFYPFSLTTKLYDNNDLNIKYNIIKSLTAPSVNKLYLLRHKFINNLKNIKTLKNIFNKKVKDFKELKYSDSYKLKYIEESNDLYKYYQDMFKYIDIIHANSKLSENIYKKIHNNIKIIPLSHNNIKECNIIKNEGKTLNLAFFGEELKDKGFNLIIDILDELYKLNNNFILNCYGPYNLYKRPYLKYHGSYKFNELKDIYRNIDLVLFPAINIESFGFIVEESLCFKTPIIVSKNVGAKDLCNNDFIINNELELKELLIKILNDKNILNNYFNYELKIDDFNNHYLKIINELYK